jgi:hypothetical protein
MTLASNLNSLILPPVPHAPKYLAENLVSMSCHSGPEVNNEL